MANLWKWNSLLKKRTEKTVGTSLSSTPSGMTGSPKTSTTPVTVTLSSKTRKWLFFTKESRISSMPTNVTPIPATRSVDESNKCLEWYNKIDDRTAAYAMPSHGECTKWYDLLKDEPTVSHRVVDDGFEYVESDFSACAATPGDNSHTLVELPISRQISERNCEDLERTIDDKLRTLNWLDDQINTRYKVLREIEENINFNRSNELGRDMKARRIKRRTRSGDVVATKSNRAQRFRDEFIKKKMKRLVMDNSDGWWKNFNAKICDRGGYENAIHSQ